MNTRLRFFFFSLLLFLSCSKNQITVPPTNPGTNLVNTVYISDTVMKNMEGIYSLTAGDGGLGNEFVCKVSKFKVSFFSNNSGIFIILDYGFNRVDSSIQFAGFWRYSETASQGLINFSVPKSAGASDLLLAGIIDHLQLTGNFADQNGGSARPVTIAFKRPFSPYVLSHEFAIFAHHGVQTTANPPYSQNSLKGALHDEEYGVLGLEFDVRLTKDNIPICMHDASFDIRLTQKGPLYGDYSQYTFAFLEAYVRLPDGEQIPSVETVLDAFIDSTTMKYFWLDIKGDPDVFKYLEPVVRNAYARAAASHRNVVLIADLPSDDVIAEYKKQPSYGADLPCMCELSLQDAIDNKCQYFGPRFSLGLLTDDVAKAHSLGIKVYSWTLNDKTIILNYLQNGQFDGFISDYPAYVVYDYYALN
jgi:glycerophosphoryl diester phosphodiesterase